MPGAARQFEPQITRTGGVPSQFRFTARCSECRAVDSYEASKPVGDELVKRHFSDKGWVLGRDRSYDLCPACLRAPRKASQNSVAREAQDRRPQATPGRSDRAAHPTAPRTQKIDDILARHLGKPTAMAEEVFRPKDGQRPSPPAPEASRLTVTPPALSPEVEHALTDMASDLKSLRSAVELMAEQLSRLVVVGGQQIEAIGRLAPLLVQSTHSLSSELQQIVDAVRTTSVSLPNTTEQISERQETPEPETGAGQDAEIRSLPQPVQAQAAVEAPEPASHQWRARNQRQKTSGQVVVKSIADAKRSNRYYTTVRLSRELWDKADFRPDDRVQIDWKGKTLSISRDPEGGVKPKSVGDTTVVLQSWRLGDLNFDQVKVTSRTASLRFRVLS